MITLRVDKPVEARNPRHDLCAELSRVPHRFPRAVAVVGVYLCLCSVAPSPAWAEDVRSKLTQVSATPKAGDKIALEDLILDLAVCYGCKIGIDNNAFAAENRKSAAAVKINVPNVHRLSLDSVLRIVLPKVDAVYEIRDNAVVVVPNTMNAQARSFPPLTAEQIKAQKKLREELATPLEGRDRDRDIEQQIRRLVLDLMPNQVSSVIDKRLDKAMERVIHINLGRGTTGSLLQKVLDEAGAIYDVQPDYIRIIPASKS